MESIKFAFAVNSDDLFEKKHFGDADKYIIYEYNFETKRMILTLEQVNIHKTIDETHGSSKKGEAIVKMLKSLDVSVLVSMQFGINIKKVNKHFVPIIIRKETIEESIIAIKNHINWIVDEIEINPIEYKVFKIDKGILKYPIK